MTTPQEQNPRAVEPDKSSQDEIKKKPDSYGEYLHQALENSGIQRVKNVLQKKSKATNFVADSFLLENNKDGFGRDFLFSFSNLYILEKLALSKQILAMQKNDVTRLQTQDVRVKVERYYTDSFNLTFLDAGGLLAKQETIRKELAEGVFWKIFTQLSQQHNPGTITPMSEQTIKLADNPVLNALYFISLNLMSDGMSDEYNLRNQLREQPLEDSAKALLLKAFEKKVVRNQDQTIEKVLFDLATGVKLTFFPSTQVINLDDLLNVDWHLAISSSLEDNMLETANQSKSSQCEAFINRSTGAQLIKALEYAKLRFSSEFEEFLIKGESGFFSDRYGGPYTEISRLLAKILWYGDLSKISSIFVNQEKMTPKQEELRALAEYPNQDPGLCALQDILLQLLERDENDRASDIEITKEAIQLSDGACFDVTTYYCQALNDGKLYQKIINGHLFLIKTHGANTLINVKPILFNGLWLPKGSLFISPNNDDQFAFLRLTPFVFDNREDMLAAFGSEIIKAETNGENAMKVENYINDLSPQ